MSSPDQFKKKLDELSQRFNLVLEGWERNFVAYKTFPGYEENKSLFQREQNNLDETNSELFLLKNNIEQSSQKLNETIQKKDSVINKLKVQNNKLSKISQNIQGSDLASAEMVKNFGTEYRIELSSLVTHSIGIALILYIFHRYH